MQCENCVYYIFDEDDECYYCEASLDEDEYARLLGNNNKNKSCPHFRLDDEYGVVRKQN